MGFDYKKYIKGLKKKLEAEIPLPEYFPASFMAEHTSFESIEAMFAAGPLAETPAEELGEALHAPEWDAFVAEHTRFPTWDEMLNAAGREQSRMRRNR